MTDLLRVYGTLCWNLSQITGRKDIPMIHLTYSPSAAEKTGRAKDPQAAYLRYLENQREELKKAVQQAPCHRLDNLASFVETHGERLCHFLEGMIGYRKKARMFRVKSFFTGLTISIIGGAAGWLGLMNLPPFAGLTPELQLTGAGALGTIILIFWLVFVQKYLYSRFLKKWLHQLDGLTPLPNQTRRDSWAAIRDLVYVNLKNCNGQYSLSQVLSDHRTVRQIYDRGSREIREALKELAGIAQDDDAWTGKESGPVPYWANTEAALDGR
jgi:hypothetical protein